VGGTDRQLRGREAVYRLNRSVGPTLKLGRGGTDRQLRGREAVYRLNWSVGSTLKN